MKYGRKTIWLIAGLLSASLLAMGAAPSINNYQETFIMAADGSGTVSTRVTLADLAPGITEVPLTTWQGLEHITVEGLPAAIGAEPVLNSDTPFLRLRIPPAAPPVVTFTMRFAVPASKAAAAAREPDKEKLLKFRFLNSTQSTVGNYRLTVLLPAGQVIHSVLEKTPQGKGGDGAAIQFMRENNRQGLVLDVQNIKFADAASVTFRALEDKKSPFLILLLGGIALVYLVVFRDIVRDPAKQKKQEA